MPDVRRSQYLSAREAAALLGVSRSSLYSYVSRGRLRVVHNGRDPRVSRYLAADVERLRDQKEARLRPEAAARKTLELGLPVLESSLTLIDAGRVYYRGRDATALARRAAFEDVVRLLWNVDGDRITVPPLTPQCRRALSAARDLPAIERMQAVLPFAAAEDAAAFDVTAEHVVSSGWRILDLLVRAATRRAAAPEASVAGRLMRGWRATDPPARRLLDMALVLCADHELNVSAFAARVAASAGSSPYDVVNAGLATLHGPRHGGHTTHVERLFDEARTPDGLRDRIAARLAAGDRLPGFGHPLYPTGDPRAALLLSAIRRALPHSPAAAYVPVLRHASRTLVHDHPTIDLALVVLRRALGLPPDAALVLFALGRTAGWIAHALEQYANGHLIRPRATYVGAVPQ